MFSLSQHAALRYSYRTKICYERNPDGREITETHGRLNRL